MKTYTAIQGDYWDGIAKKLWDDEGLMHHLLAANPDLRRVVTFSGGEILVVPDVEIKKPAAPLPPWKQS